MGDILTVTVQFIIILVPKTTKKKMTVTVLFVKKPQTFSGSKHIKITVAFDCCCSSFVDSLSVKKKERKKPPAKRMEFSRKINISHERAFGGNFRFRYGASLRR